MKINTIKYFLKDSLRSLKRNRTLSIASIATVAATLFILGVFILVLLTIGQGMAEVESKVEVKVFLKDNITTVQKSNIESKLNSIDGVSGVTYESKEEALNKFKAQLGDQYKSLVAGYDKKNPMPDSYIVKVQKPEIVSNVVDGIKNMDGIEVIKDGRDIVNIIVKLSSTLKWVGGVILAVLIGLSLFLIGNTIKITVYNRRREIGIMKYIGATDWFIRWPFIFEGIVIGITGSIISILLLYYGYRLAYVQISSGFMVMQLINPVYILNTMLWEFLLIGMCIGIFGSISSIRKFLAV
jgi:cell division transport system permease protein